MNNETITLLLLFLLTQNKNFMAELSPALDFLEHHQSTIATISALFTPSSVPNATNGATTPLSNNQQSVNDTTNDEILPPDCDKNTHATTPNERKKTQSPLQRIANERIFSSIQAYLSKPKP